MEQAAEALEPHLVEVLDRQGGAPKVLREAMRHALLGGGKRLRPALVLACCRWVGGREEDALPGALAVELVHGYSLVHDDLPCMDDDDLRRGRPTVHKAFGEGLAVLAGDALLTLAFEVLARGPAPAERKVAAAAELARAAGAEGMVGGQVMDLEAEGKDCGIEEVEAIHRGKTAALLAASCRIGGLLGGGARERVEVLGRYGEALGLAFQIVDDCLDETSDPRTLGKAAGKDRDHGKATWPGAVGLEAARERAGSLAREAARWIGDRTGVEPEGRILQDLALFVVERNR